MKYFGTDGIRDKADMFTPEFLAKIIRGLIDYAGNNITIMLGGDTRESTEWILSSLESACETFGLEYTNVGILPTPAINYCFYQMGYDFAIDVTASHNPYTDNGIKIFARGENTGVKLPEQACQTIENSLSEDLIYDPVATTIRNDFHADAISRYQSHLVEYIGKADFTGLNIAIDCANGATSVIGSQIFDQFKATTTLIHANQSYNREINHNCGSTHLESLQELVTNNHLDFGIAFDGDGDRCLMIDETGAIVDGDQIIAILADYLQLDSIAITVMANQGLLNWAKKRHIHTEITPVGDSNVAEAIKTHHIKLGGEQSGHIILPNEPTGDGMLTALMIAKVASKTPLSKLASVYTKYPQIIVNLPATKDQKQSFKSNANVKELLLDYSKKLNPTHGRLLVRPSGTEPLIRITMWGEDSTIITTLANELKNKLGEIL